MEATFIRSRKAVTVQQADNTHKALVPGEPVEVATLSEYFQSELRKGNSWTAQLFEECSEADFNSWQAGNRVQVPKDFDARLAEMGKLTLPGPDEQAVVQDGDDMVAAKTGDAPTSEVTTVSDGNEEQISTTQNDAPAEPSADETAAAEAAHEEQIATTQNDVGPDTQVDTSDGDVSGENNDTTPEPNETASDTAPASSDETTT